MKNAIQELQTLSEKISPSSVSLSNTIAKEILLNLIRYIKLGKDAPKTTSITDYDTSSGFMKIDRHGDDDRWTVYDVRWHVSLGRAATLGVVRIFSELGLDAIFQDATYEGLLVIAVKNEKTIP